ncbi:hypothetical protein BDV35DRAFT_380538 [Aspergillus flavus]|uniref:DNA, SC138 n=2 Tax=Aspergillus subgen. Circumdati TaxID=2720871 RepID=Q2U1K2_ASPOR|nr:unnamed protein product [Aspergillus oryzae RIB40]KAB8246617.1 hypothetical protein BDV35DRAFT_380538 [Aspergillus flavus]BAE64563.1 unnamed protein product [Aspergillus oryzae RIB40]
MSAARSNRTLSWPTSPAHASFLSLLIDLYCIGSVNAGFLAYLQINFPATERVDGQLDKIKIREDGWQNLRLLQEHCTNLQTLETVVYGPNCVLVTDNEINISNPQNNGVYETAWLDCLAAQRVDQR